MNHPQASVVYSTNVTKPRIPRVFLTVKSWMGSLIGKEWLSWRSNIFLILNTMTRRKSCIFCFFGLCWFHWEICCSHLSIASGLTFLKCLSKTPWLLGSFLQLYPWTCLWVAFHIWQGCNFEVGQQYPCPRVKALLCTRWELQDRCARWYCKQNDSWIVLKIFRDGYMALEKRS